MRTIRAARDEADLVLATLPETGETTLSLGGGSPRSCFFPLIVILRNVMFLKHRFKTLSTTGGSIPGAK
eukprot:6959120-Prorocentrum_lima.AAC.1